MSELVEHITDARNNGTINVYKKENVLHESCTFPSGL